MTALCALGLLWASLMVPRAHCLIRATVLELRSSAFSLFCSPSPCFAWFSKTLQLPLGSSCKGAFLCMGTLPVLGLPPSLGAQALSRGSLSCPFFISLSFLLPHSRELSLSPVPQPEAWGLLLSSRGCFVGVVPFLVEFLMCLWGGW